MDILCIFFIGLWWKLNFKFFHVFIVKFLNDFLNLTIILFFRLLIKYQNMIFNVFFVLKFAFHIMIIYFLFLKQYL